MNAPFHFRVNPPWGDLPYASAVTRGRAHRYQAPEFTTTLTLKSVVRGAARWRTRLGEYRVDAGSFLLLNHGQTYALDFEGREETETLCLFFQPGFLETAAASRRTAERLLDDPSPTEAAGFVERLHPKRDRLAGLLRRLHEGLAAPLPASWLEERFYEAGHALLEVSDGVRREVDAMPALRRATREELYGRLHRARDYADSCLGEPLTVERLARVACLSPFHFQRAFRAAFRVSPMKYVQERRLQAARALLLGTDKPVGEVCAAVGFESPGSFSWLFRRRFGASPRELRRSP